MLALNSLNSHKRKNTVIILKQRLREAKRLAHTCTAGNEDSWNGRVSRRTGKSKG